MTCVATQKGITGELTMTVLSIEVFAFVGVVQVADFALLTYISWAIKLNPDRCNQSCHRAKPKNLKLSFLETENVAIVKLLKCISHLNVMFFI